MQKIGVFDSGVGGLTVLDELVRYLPHESFIYYGDSKNNPYGEKSEEELYKLVKNVVLFLTKKDVKLIVIACNTATTKCISRLRNEFNSIIFVGTEPAVKLACDEGFHRTLVMATPATIESEKVKELVLNNKKDNQEITLMACPNLANLIEMKDPEGVDNLLRNLFKEYSNTEFDAIVLGCTHYPIIKENIRNLNPNSVILDGTMGVVKEVKRQLHLHNMEELEGKGTVEVYNSLKMDESA